MRVKIELTLDEFNGIKGTKDGGTILNGYHFLKIGDEESQKKQIEVLEKGLEHTAFLLQKLILAECDIPTEVEIIQVEIVKSHAERVLPDSEFLLSKLQSKGFTSKTGEYLKMDNEEIKLPICPINFYFEGDEDRCDVSKCDWDTETRSCTETCKKD